jgi:hypothetical protein
MKRSSFLSLILWLCLPVSKFINRVNWRFGRPFSCNFKEIEPVKDNLQPGMVILTHRKYEFSTLFIPGYWTHSALVVSPGFIVEATGKGVRTNRVESFFSAVDDFIILKPRFCCQDMMKKAGEYASTLVGFPFSFDFRNSDEMFYCSGLICRVYVQLMTEHEKYRNIPFILKNFLNGYIIKPMDLFAHHEAWQVIGSFNKNSNQCDYRS